MLRTQVRAFLVAVVLLVSSAGSAMANVTGDIIGRVVDKGTGSPVGGVTITATGPQGEHHSFTNDDGSYQLQSLPIGRYVVRFYAGDATVEQPDVVVSVDKTIRLNISVPTGATKAETITVVEKAPSVDVGSSRVSVTLDKDFLRNTPAAENMSGVLDKAPGAYYDPSPFFYVPSFTGYSLSGGTGADNAYYLDGVNITSIGYGLLGSDLPNAFVDEIELISHGYNAEYGRALGGVVNIATKSGTNKWGGSAFMYLSPGFLAGKPKRPESFVTSMTSTVESTYATQYGAEVGGPILKDRLFLWVGYAPEMTRNKTIRYLHTFQDVTGAVDANGDPIGDGIADGPATQEARRTAHGGEFDTHNYAGKLSYRIGTDHDMSIAYYGRQSANEYLRQGNADISQGMTKETLSSNDLSARWISKFFNRRWEIEANAGMHMEGSKTESPNEVGRNTNQVIWSSNPSLSLFEPTLAEVGGPCEVKPVNPADPMSPTFDPCPAGGYMSGGHGISRDTEATRLFANLKSSHLFRLAGWHNVKYGLEAEFNHYNEDRYFSGPAGNRALMVNVGIPVAVPFFKLPPGKTNSMFLDAMTPNAIAGDPLADPNMDGRPGDLINFPYYQDNVVTQTRTENYSFFFQEGYSPLSNLTINAGLRWEIQKLGNDSGETAVTIGNSVAPRIGVVYDFTKTGRSKIYGHYGHFYESIPQNLTNRGFGGEGIAQAAWFGCDQTQASTMGWRSCGAPDLLFVGQNDRLAIQKKLKGTRNDEITLGAQYEPIDDLVLGAAYIRRTMGSVLEDVGAPNGLKILANPGDVPSSVVDEAEKNAVAAEAAVTAGTGSRSDASEARALADALKAARDMPKAKRDYNALQLTASKRFSKNWLLLASYTLSSTRGNYPGLYSADMGQLDPNFSSLFDDVSLLINRDGPLPNDRPHVVRVDGYHTFNWGTSSFVTGLGAVARSGRPLNHLGSNPTYGTDTTFILPRGSGGRAPAVSRFDLHLGYKKKLPDDTELEIFVDVFNLFNQRATLLVDDRYTLDAVNPIVGGTTSDLAHLTNAYSGAPVTKNPNYGKATAYQAPIAGRLGLRLLF